MRFHRRSPNGIENNKAHPLKSKVQSMLQTAQLLIFALAFRCVP